MKTESISASNKTDWKPRNKQTAIVISRASWIHRAPQEQGKIVTPEQRHAEWLKSLREQIDSKEYEKQCAAERKKIRREAKEAHLAANPKRPRVSRQGWATRHLRRLNKTRGLPPPTKEQIQEFKKKQPGYGKPLFNVPDQIIQRQLACLKEPARDFYERTLAEMGCFGKPYQSQHDAAFKKALDWQIEQKLKWANQ